MYYSGSPHGILPLKEPAGGHGRRDENRTKVLISLPLHAFHSLIFSTTTVAVSKSNKSNLNSTWAKKGEKLLKVIISILQFHMARIELFNVVLWSSLLSFHYLPYYTLTRLTHARSSAGRGHAESMWSILTTRVNFGQPMTLCGMNLTCDPW